MAFRAEGSGQLARGSVAGGGVSRRAKGRLQTHLGPLGSSSWRPRLSLKRQKDVLGLRAPLTLDHSHSPSSSTPSTGSPYSMANLHPPLQPTAPMYLPTHTYLQLGPPILTPTCTPFSPGGP